MILKNRNLHDAAIKTNIENKFLKINSIKGTIFLYFVSKSHLNCQIAFHNAQRGIIGT